MFAQIAKWALFAALWRQARPYLAGTALAAASLFLVNTVHGEYVEYLSLAVEVAEESDVGAPPPDPSYLFYSYIAKWTLYAVIAVGYWVYAMRKTVARRKPVPAGARGAAEPASSRPGAPDTYAEEAATGPHSQAMATDQAQADAEDQAFDFLRGKRRLEGRGDKLLK